MEFMGEVVNIDINKAKYVCLDEILYTDEKNPILYTKDFKTCIVVLIVCQDRSYMAHIFDLESFNLLKEKFKNIIENEKVVNIRMFQNPTIANIFSEETEYKSRREFLNELLSFFGQNEFYSGFLDMDSINSSGVVSNCSIGYNNDTKEYYGIDSSDNFYEYQLGYENKTKNPFIR